MAQLDRGGKCLVLHISNRPKGAKDGAMLKAMGMRAGAPDLLVLSDGKVIAWELKAEKGRQEPAQKYFQQDWEMYGGEYIITYGREKSFRFAEERGLL